MDQVSRPMQVLLLVTLAFAAVWFVALRPKAGTGGGTPPAAPAQAAKPAERSAIPGGLGNAVDRARETKLRGDAAAGAPAAKPATKPAAAKPAAVAATPKPAPAAAKPKPARARPEPAGASPRKVRRALARGHAVVLLFYSAAGSDDRAVRGELAGISGRGGRVESWAVSVRGLSRFKNVLAGAQILQTPTVLVLSPRGRQPVLLPGYTDRTEIDQVAAAALRRR